MAVLPVLYVLLLLVASPAVSAVQVTCGSTVKLQHVGQSSHLHSHEVAYGSGSGQQSVTGLPEAADGGSLWFLTGSPGKGRTCTPGATITKGTRVRLQHATTSKWLHSHLHRSPLTSKQEVSAYGADDVSDSGDVWQVSWDGSASVWTAGLKVAFKHVDTGAWLVTSNKQYPRPISGQFEVAAAPRKDASAQWRVVEGVFLPSDVHEDSSDEL